MQVEAAFTDVMAAYADPQPLLDAFGAAARRAIAEGASVIVPGEGPLNVFLADQGVVDEHLAHLGRPFHGGTSTNTGDAHAWLVGLGARFRNMGAALRSGLVVVGHGTRVSPALQVAGAVLLDTSGSRFVDEEAHGYSSLAGILQQQPGDRAALVWDATAMAATRESEMMRESLAAGAVATLPTLAALAEQLGITVAAAEEAIAPGAGGDRCGRRATSPG